MSIVLGIDTGGTFTDGVIYDNSRNTVLTKAKTPTVHADLSESVSAVLDALDFDKPEAIDKIVLSTTLATNAIVEGKGRPVGLIAIGAEPKDPLPTPWVKSVAGKIGIKGKELMPLDEDAAEKAIEALMPHAEAFAVSGMMSTRNNSHELAVKAMIENKTTAPVICAHALSGQLGFHDRTVTAVLNAGLIPIIHDFIGAVIRALDAKKITAPVFIVKGDGHLATLDFIKEKPVETILSGPAASMIGAVTLSGADNAIVADMGGTTTDTGIVTNRSLTLSPVGAKVGRWQTHVDSAKLTTTGLGGDSAIVIENGKPVLTPARVIPACRRADAEAAPVLTPTDILHLSGELSRWDTKKAKKALDAQAEACGSDPKTLLSDLKNLVYRRIDEDVLKAYADLAYPVLAIGAPAGSWYHNLRDRTGRDAIIPEHHEVAAAVGAAVAAVEERATALVRPDEENDGFVAHIMGETASFSDKDTAVAFAADAAKARVTALAEAQGVGTPTVSVDIQTIENRTSWKTEYIKTVIHAVARAASVQSVREESKSYDYHLTGN